jgi:hypothetical protein
MVPGDELGRGHFIEHPLTQGVNNLYEGITICTIQPAPGITFLGQSHDGQMCLGCFEREGQRIVLDTGFTKLYREFFQKSAGLGRYLSNIAFWLARGARGIEYELLTTGRDEIETIANGEQSKGYGFPVTDGATTCVLQWDGQATMALILRAPDGSVAHREVSSSTPLRVKVPAGASGTWVAQVEGVDVSHGRLPYVVSLSHEAATEGGANAVTVPPVAGQTVMPFYLVVDVSDAAAGTIGDLNAALDRIRRDLMSDPQLNGTAMLSVIAFGDTARTVTPLGAPSTITVPALTAGGDAAYGAAIREYHRAFEQDRSRLKAEGARVVRPCVFLVSQSEPGDTDYARTLHSLLAYDPGTRQGNPAYPHIVAFGLPGASRRALTALAYPDFGDEERRGRWFVSDPRIPVGQALGSVVEAIGQSIRKACGTAAQGVPVFVPPTSVPGTVGGVAVETT